MTPGKTFRLLELADRFGGTLVGDPHVLIARIATLSRASAGDISFLSHPKYRSQLSNTGASAVIVDADGSKETELPRIVSDNPYLYFAKVSQLLNPVERADPGIHPSAVFGTDCDIPASASIGPGCVLGDGVQVGDGVLVGANCTIGANTRIGEQSRLFASVAIYPGCSIGKRCIVHSGAVIGSDGFGLARDGERWTKIPQIGSVVIGDDVEIGANTTIDRGALDDTVLEDGVKLDNQIQIGHNVVIGANSALAGCVGVAGSARVGRRCTVGGGAIILGHLEIADDVHISAGTLITKSVREPGSYAGIYPFDSKREWARNAVHLRHLDSLVESIRGLEKRLATLERKE
ncbi:MAG: UDP-3-O-(3-hydroxymyristoyl)glucosamine N-acyltransferase [Betaproteobacteria bacterium]|nr:UDP-3-O-(3-hydroxymyristoyl)glucosamine N-acyltransferase [Betaproteobacteria bacterium]